MRETGLWRAIREELSPFGRLVRVENRAEPGTPDVAYCISIIPERPAVQGWCELKKLDALPVRSDTPLRLPELTKDQVLWHEGWSRAGGRVCAILGVGQGVTMRTYRLDPALLRSAFELRLTARAMVACCEARGHAAVGRDRGKWFRWLTA